MNKSPKRSSLLHGVLRKSGTWPDNSCKKITFLQIENQAGNGLAAHTLLAILRLEPGVDFVENLLSNASAFVGATSVVVDSNSHTT